MMGTTLELRKVADKSGPEPDRNERMKDGRLRNPSLREGELLNPWPLSHVELRRGSDLPETHAFTEDFVRQGLVEGWVSLFKGCIVLHLKNDEGESTDVHYKVVKPPSKEIGVEITHDYQTVLEVKHSA